MCNNFLINPEISHQVTQRSLANIPFRNLQERLFHALASLLQVSLTNYTYDMFGNYVCINGRKIKRKLGFDFNIWSKLFVKGVHSKFSVYQILSLPENVTNLRFISCGGSRGKQSILFSELVNVYDRYVWACSILSSLVLTVIIHRTYSRELPFYANFLNTICLMIEQNDKLFDCALNKANIRFTVGSFLLASLVLSYAYRSENVYNITKLRKLIPYERFQELLDNKFTIYSRLSIYILTFHHNAMIHMVYILILPLSILSI